MKRQSLRDEILRLYQDEHKTVTQIAAELGCTKANVSITIKRALSWNQIISPPLPQSIVAWVMEQSEEQRKSPSTVARDIIIAAYNQREKTE